MPTGSRAPRTGEPDPVRPVLVVDLGAQYAQLIARRVREARVFAGRKATLEEILVGPAHENDGTLNLFGALRTSMATTGYASIKEFQKAELVMAPSIKSEGKAYQQAQHVGMGH